MVDPVNLGPVRSLPQSPRASTAKTEVRASVPAPAHPEPSAASLPKLIGLAADLAKQGPPVDYARIAQIRQAIAKGDYSIDADRIAHAMIGFYRNT